MLRIVVIGELNLVRSVNVVISGDRGSDFIEKC